MPASDSSPFQDPDDWFGEPAWTSGAPGAKGASPSGGWNEGESAEVRPGFFADLTVTLRTLLVAAGVVVIVLVLIGLAIGGVFSGSGHDRGASPATEPTATTTPLTTPTTTVAPPRRPASPASTLKPGDTGAQVKLLQRALARLGETPGGIDGDYGPSTVAAVKRFQKAAGLPTDGVLGPKTLRALEQALGTSSR